PAPVRAVLAQRRGRRHAGQRARPRDREVVRPGPRRRPRLRQQLRRRREVPARATCRAASVAVAATAGPPRPRLDRGKNGALETPPARRAPPASCRDRPGGLLPGGRSEEHTSELQSRENLVCRLLLEKKKTDP